MIFLSFIYILILISSYIIVVRFKLGCIYWESKIVRHRQSFSKSYDYYQSYSYSLTLHWFRVLSTKIAIELNLSMIYKKSALSDPKKIFIIKLYKQLPPCNSHNFGIID